MHSANKNLNTVLEAKTTQNFNSEEEYNSYIKNELANNSTTADLFIFRSSDIKIYSKYLRNLKYLFSQNFLNTYKTESGSFDGIYNSQLYSFVNIHIKIVLSYYY